MRFDPPVRVATGKAGNVIKAVTDAEKAAHMLLDADWPADQKARRQIAARKAVLAALERAQDPVRAERARKAFAAAAQEAGVLMPDRPASVASPGFKSPKWRKR